MVTSRESSGLVSSGNYQSFVELLFIFVILSVKTDSEQSFIPKAFVTGSFVAIND